MKALRLSEAFAQGHARRERLGKFSPDCFKRASRRARAILRRALMN